MLQSIAETALRRAISRGAVGRTDTATSSAITVDRKSLKLFPGRFGVVFGHLKRARRRTEKQPRCGWRAFESNSGAV
jgi:hypothetical protein